MAGYGVAARTLSFLSTARYPCGGTRWSVTAWWDLFTRRQPAQGKNHTQGKNQEPEEKLPQAGAGKTQKVKQRGATAEAGANPACRSAPELRS